MLFLSENVAEKTMVLEWTKQIHTMLKKLEPLADTDPEVDKLLKAMLWPTSVWVREAITGCAECSYRGFAADTLEDLTIACRGFTVKCIEDLHRNLNVKARQDYNGDISRSMRWHVANTCEVIENMDHKQPEPTPQEKRRGQREIELQAVRHLHLQVFHGRNHIQRFVEH